MLVIGRRPGEGLIVEHRGETLNLNVWIEDNQIKVGIDAPRSFAVLRDELRHENMHRFVQRDRRFHAGDGMGRGLADGPIRGAGTVLPSGAAEALAGGADSR